MQHLNFIPKYYASGVLSGRQYLIIEKLEGETLYQVWNKLSDTKKAEVIRQIADILKIFHNQDYTFLASKFIHNDWLAMWRKSFDLNIKILTDKGFDTKYFSLIKENILPIIFKNNKYALIHNDIHFDNLILCNYTIKLIDFDRILYAATDYELMIINHMCENPKKFSSEEDLSNIKNEDYLKILDMLKNEYPELFEHEYFKERQEIYSIIYNLGDSYENCNLGQIGSVMIKAENLYKNFI